MTRHTSHPEIHESSGNVFADLYMPDAEDLSIQSELSRLIYQQIKRLKMTQAQAGDRLGLRQPDVSKLMNGRYSGFSAERLIRFLNALDQDVQIVVRQRPLRAHRSARMTVVAA